MHCMQHWLPFHVPPSVRLTSLSLPSLQSIKRKDDTEEVKVQIQFMVYGTRVSKDKSGAYLFLPDGKAKVRFLSVI